MQMQDTWVESYIADSFVRSSASPIDKAKANEYRAAIWLLVDTKWRHGGDYNLGPLNVPYVRK